MRTRKHNPIITILGFWGILDHITKCIPFPEDLKKIPEKLRATVKEACTDLNEVHQRSQRSFTAGRTRHEPLSYRKTLWRRLRELAQKRNEVSQKTLNPEQYAIFKESMWMLRKHRQELNKEEKPVLDLLFECSPELQKAYDLREELYSIFKINIPFILRMNRKILLKNDVHSQFLGPSAWNCHGQSLKRKLCNSIFCVCGPYWPFLLPHIARSILIGLDLFPQSFVLGAQLFVFSNQLPNQFEQLLGVQLYGAQIGIHSEEQFKSRM